MAGKEQQDDIFGYIFNWLEFGFMACFYRSIDYECTFAMLEKQNYKMKEGNFYG